MEGKKMKRVINVTTVALISLFLIITSVVAGPGKRRRLRDVFNDAAKKRAKYPFNKAAEGDKSGVKGRSLMIAPPRVDGTKKKNRNNLPGPKL